MIRNFIIRLIVNAIALVVTAYILPTVHINLEFGNVLLIALVFGIINALIKPIVKLLSLPLILATLGLFSLIINAVMLWLTERLINDPAKFHIDGFLPTVLAALIMAIVSVILEWILKRIGLGDD